MTFDNCKYNNLKCLCTYTVHVLSLFLTLWIFCTSDPSTSHDPKGEREREGEGEEEREREEREGGRRKGREEKGILKILYVSLTFWNDFILTVSRRIR